MSKEALRRKLVPISYDLSLSHMGLSMEDSAQMKDTNIVIHCACTSEYENSLEWNLEVVEELLWTRIRHIDAL